MPKGRDGRKRALENKAKYDPENMMIDVMDLERQLEARLTNEERWALNVMFGPPNKHLTDEDKRKARKVVRDLSREMSQVNFGKRLVYASMQEEVPIEKQAALLPYALPKAPTEVEMTVRKEDMSDDQIDARIRELIGADPRDVIDA